LRIKSEKGVERTGFGFKNIGAALLSGLEELLKRRTIVFFRDVIVNLIDSGTIKLGRGVIRL
jgi:hypothetical protein